MNNIAMILRKCADLRKTAEVELPASKSISNRVLLVSKLAGMELSSITGISAADDSRQLLNALNNDSEKELRIQEGAAPLRFLLAYRAAKNLPCTIHCGEYLIQRPIQPMLNTLAGMGAKIELCGNSIAIEKGIDNFGHISIEANQSSQFCSALMMVAPLFPGDKKIKMQGTVASKSYLLMTAEVMQKYGVECMVDNDEIRISRGAYKPVFVEIEKDWSAAAFIYALVAVFNGPETLMRGLFPHSEQGDNRARELFSFLGVDSSFVESGVIIRKTKEASNHLSFNFTDCPDLAPPVIAACAALGIETEISGLENLRFKESDRIEAINRNLRHFDIELVQQGPGWVLQYREPRLKKEIHINDFNDHRIAMAFSIFTKLSDLQIENPDCVNKSFPGFWKESQPWFRVES